MEVPAKTEGEYAEKSFGERGGIKIVRNPSERKEKVLNTKDNIDSVQEFSIFDLFPPISRIRKSKDNVNSVEAKPILQRFSSLQTGLTCLDGVTEKIKLKMEQNLLIYLEKFRSSLDNNNQITFGAVDKSQFKMATRDYYCVLNGGQGHSYIDMSKRLLQLSATLMGHENEYVGILQGKSSKKKEDVLQNIVLSRRELEDAEKVYLISRWRHVPVRPLFSNYSLDYTRLLSHMTTAKTEMMKLECEYIELLQDGATFSEDILSQYPEDILQGAVSMERELLVLDHPELIEMITGENHSSLPDSLRSLANVTDTMKHARSYSLWEQQEMYPNFVEDLNIDYKINRLENLVNSRKGYLALEDEYLRLLQERHTKNHVHQIHLEYIWEHILKLTLSWKKNLRLMEDALAPDRREKRPLEFEYAEGIRKMIKEAEQEYYELIQKQHSTILNGISTMDVTQVYAKYIHKELLDRIAYLRRKIKPLEREHNHILRKVMYDRIEKQAIVSRGITFELWKAVRQYFDRLIYNIQTRNFLQPPVKMEDSESMNNSVEEEEEFMTTLYYSVKSLSIYCVECMSCINNLIQQALGLEDDDDYKLSPKISYEGEKCNEVVDKFLYLRSIYCPNCIRVVRRVTLQHVLGQSSTTSIPNQGGEAICNEEGSVITMPPNETITIIGQSSRVGRRWKIGSCIVVGGLMESITSLVIVTAATTANMSDGNIVALAFTNLITGLFIVRHDVSRLQKKNRINKECARIEVEGNRFKETIYYLLNFMITFLSFLFFGLVPPLVYALSSLKTTNKNFKIIATAGASLSCTAFLAIQKAHIIQGTRNWIVYVKTAAIYVSVGVGAFAISYLAGFVFRHLSEKLLWVL